MDVLFPYSHPVTGPHFIGRKNDVLLLSNLLMSNGESVALYSTPKAGRESLIRQTLTLARVGGNAFTTAVVSLQRSRTTADVLVEFADGLLRSCGSTPGEFKTLVAEHLKGTHFVFDEALYASTGRTISANWLLDNIDMRAVFSLPSTLARSKGTRIVVLVEEFQNIMWAEDAAAMLDALEEVVMRRDTLTPFLFTGSRMNAMREIFEVKRRFWRTVVRFEMGQVDAREIAEYVYKGFSSMGKVLEKDLIVGAADLLQYNMWYVCQLFSILDSISRGYVNSDSVDEAMGILVGIHRPRFLTSVYSLSAFQLNLLEAILDGETRFSSSSLISRYNLSSSANVKRLKDALIKKEIVWFDDKDDPHIQDPLFEYWLRGEYFGQNNLPAALAK